MLVLSRKKDEDVIIGPEGNQIVVTVVDIRGDKVRLGFSAPENVPIHRREVYNAIAESGRQQKLAGEGASRVTKPEEGSSAA